MKPVLLNAISRYERLMSFKDSLFEENEKLRLNLFKGEGEKSPLAESRVRTQATDSPSRRRRREHRSIDTTAAVSGKRMMKKVGVKSDVIKNSIVEMEEPIPPPAVSEDAMKQKSRIRVPSSIYPISEDLPVKKYIKVIHALAKLNDEMEDQVTRVREEFDMLTTQIKTYIEDGNNIKATSRTKDSSIKREDVAAMNLKIAGLERKCFQLLKKYFGSQ